MRNVNVAGGNFTAILLSKCRIKSTLSPGDKSESSGSARTLARALTFHNRPEGGCNW